MRIVPFFVDINASVDKFEILQTTDRGWITISPKSSGLTTIGTGTYTVYASNVDSGNQADFFKFSLDTNDVPYNEGRDIPNFGYQYMGILYRANGAEGEYQLFVKL